MTDELDFSSRKRRQGSCRGVKFSCNLNQSTDREHMVPWGAVGLDTCQGEIGDEGREKGEPVSHTKKSGFYLTCDWKPLKKNGK